MNTVYTRVKLSPFAAHVLKSQSQEELELALERFADITRNSRYRDHLYPPRFRTLPNGQRVAALKANRDQTAETVVGFSLNTLRSIGAMRRRNLSLSWIIEEALFYFQNESAA